MSFFNFRRAGSSSPPNAASNAKPESVEVVRKRAKHRLIGAAVLVLAGVVGFPLLFDTQPRPIAVDIPIEIPGKTAVKPLVMPAKPDVAAAAPPTPTPIPTPARAASTPATAPAATPDTVTAASSLTPKEEILVDKKVVAQAPPAPPAIKTEAKPAPKADVKPPAKAPVPADDGDRAMALLSGQAVPPLAAVPAATGSEARLVVQVGAFSDAVKAREVRLKLEKAGLKTYTQIAETPAGKRIRVRVGPFVTRAEAEKAVSKIKTLDLPAAILTL